MSDKENTDQTRADIALAKVLFNREPNTLEQSIAKAFAPQPTTKED